jgi:hypothetical protein
MHETTLSSFSKIYLFQGNVLGNVIFARKHFYTRTPGRLTCVVIKEIVRIRVPIARSPSQNFGHSKNIPDYTQVSCSASKSLFGNPKLSKVSNSK